MNAGPGAAVGQAVDLMKLVNEMSPFEKMDVGAMLYERLINKERPACLRVACGPHRSPSSPRATRCNKAL